VQDSWVQFLHQYPGLKLTEYGVVGSGWLRSCYQNFCHDHNIAPVPELENGIDPRSIQQFLYKYNMSFEQTTAVDIGRIRGITMQQQLALDNNHSEHESEQLEKMKEQILDDKVTECLELLAMARDRLSAADAKLIETDKSIIKCWRPSSKKQQIDEMMKCIRRQAFPAFPRPLPDFVLSVGHCKMEDLEAYAEISTLQKSICWHATASGMCLQKSSIPNDLNKMSLQELQVVWAKMME
jgi:hypothetical protein